jgi:hypothetical protein
VNEIKIVGLFLNLVGTIFLATAIPLKVEGGRIYARPIEWWYKISWYGGLLLLAAGFILQLVAEY